MTTLVPRQPYTDDELQKLYPAGLELQLVQVLMRHGERTPITGRFRNTGLSPFWPYCASLKQFKSAVLVDDQDPGVAGVGKGGGGAATRPMGTFEWKQRLETFGNNDEAVLATGKAGQLDSLCDMGMLTDPGRLTTLRLGQRLRKLYVDRLGYLPKTVGANDVDRLFQLRATPVPRALESMQQAFTGLYPERENEKEQPLTIVSRAMADETLFPNDYNCRRFAAVSRAFAQRAAERWNDTEELAYVTKKIGHWLPANSPRVAVDGKPRLSGVMDTVNATLAHGPETRLPEEFYDKQSRRNIEKAALEEWFAGYLESVEYRALGIGSLMGDLTARMVAQAETQGTSGHNGLFRFGLSGCHDTTLAAVLSSLGHKMPNWPPFTSHLAVELFKKLAPAAATSSSSSSSGWTAFLPSFLAGSSSSSIGRKPTPELTNGKKQKLAGYYVRIRYNDEVVSVPGCKPVGKHLDGDESFCTLVSHRAQCGIVWNC